MGGGTFLTERVSLIVQFSPKGNRYWLHGAVLARGRDKHWYLLSSSTKAVSQPPAPPLQKAGGGGSIGRYFIFIENDSPAVWLNNDVRIPLDGGNVLLLDEVDDPANAPRIFGHADIAPDLGPASLPPLSPESHSEQQMSEFMRKMLLENRQMMSEVIRRLYELPAVIEFLGVRAGAHPPKAHAPPIGARGKGGLWQAGFVSQVVAFKKKND